MLMNVGSCRDSWLLVWMSQAPIGKSEYIISQALTSNIAIEKQKQLYHQNVNVNLRDQLCSCLSECKWEDHNTWKGRIKLKHPRKSMLSFQPSDTARGFDYINEYLYCAQPKGIQSFGWICEQSWESNTRCSTAENYIFSTFTTRVGK